MAKGNSIVIAILNGEFTVKLLHRKNKNVFLIPENPDFSPIEIKESDEFEIWGIVSYIIHKAI